jgi:hypothetical protein
MPDVRSGLERRCEEVLHYVWDPIGVSHEPGARDEYSGYVPHLCALLRDGATQDDVAAYLDSAVGAAMGLEPDAGRAADAAALLIKWRDWLGEAPTTEDDFWIRLEFRLCREFDGYDEWRKLGLWCDGLHPNVFRLDSSPQEIEGEAWIGMGPKHQERWSFRLVLPTPVHNRAEIDWSSLLPPEDSTRWVAVKAGAKCLELDPGTAVPEEN